MCLHFYPFIYSQTLYFFAFQRPTRWLIPATHPSPHGTFSASFPGSSSQGTHRNFLRSGCEERHQQSLACICPSLCLLKLASLGSPLVLAYRYVLLTQFCFTLTKRRTGRKMARALLSRTLRFLLARSYHSISITVSSQLTFSGSCSYLDGD